MSTSLPTVLLDDEYHHIPGILDSPEGMDRLALDSTQTKFDGSESKTDQMRLDAKGSKSDAMESMIDSMHIERSDSLDPRMGQPCWEATDSRMATNLKTDSGMKDHSCPATEKSE